VAVDNGHTAWLDISSRFEGGILRLRSAGLALLGAFLGRDIIALSTLWRTVEIGCAKAVVLMRFHGAISRRDS
jgi:hypothetical protein